MENENHRIRFELKEPIPKISIVVPNYNAGSTLETTLLSILDQNYPKLELIVIDGGSTDDSVEIIKRYEDRLAYWISEKDRGHYDAVNKGFAQATGDVFAWLNSDDTYFPWTLRVVGKAFGEVPEMQWLMGIPATKTDGVVFMVMDLAPKNQQMLRAGIYEGGQYRVIQQESTFWRRELWEAAGPLNIKYNWAGDFELWTRFARHGELVVTDMLLGSFHHHGDNRSVVEHDDYWGQVKQVIEDLPEEEREWRADFQKKVKLLKRLSGTRLGYRLGRAITKLRLIKAPIVRWRSEVVDGKVRSQFEVERVKLY